MTEKMSEYLKKGALLTTDLLMTDEATCEKIAHDRQIILEKMSIPELKNLKNYVTVAEYNRCILPCLKRKREQCATSADYLHSEQKNNNKKPVNKSRVSAVAQSESGKSRKTISV